MACVQETAMACVQARPLTRTETRRPLLRKEIHLIKQHNEHGLVSGEVESARARGGEIVGVRGRAVSGAVETQNDWCFRALVFKPHQLAHP